MYSNYKIKSLKDLHKLNKLASQEDFDIYVGTQSIMINAKSILALFVALGREVRIIAPDHVDYADFLRFIHKLKQ